MFKVGLAYFSENMDAYPWDFQMENLNRKDWKISLHDNQSSSKINATILSKVVKADVEEISATSSNNPSILKSIAHISFSALKTLYIGDNQIVNIELIALFNCPAIRNISIHKNNISNIRGFRKLKSDQIQTIGLLNNQITELDSLREFSSQNLKRIYIQNSYPSYSYTAMTNIAAWQTQSLQVMLFKQLARVSQINAKKMLQGKFGHELKGKH